jgi:hypothetical protein
MVVDLSNTGAQVRGAATLRPGDRGTLAIDGVGFALPFVVRHGQDGIFGLTFPLDDAMEAKFAGVPERLLRRHAA